MTGCGAPRDDDARALPRSAPRIFEPDATTLALLPAPTSSAELDTNEPKYVKDAHAFLVGVPEEVRPLAKALNPPELHKGIDVGLLALSADCPRDRTNLEHCAPSRFFECPLCGSRFNALGDPIGGPTPRGMTRYPIDIDEREDVFIDVKDPIAGPPPGTATARHDSAGPHCS